MLASVIVLLPFLTSRVEGDQDVFFAAILYRHGDRTPVHPYPNDPYKNESLWPVKFGELTNTGKLQHYKLGQWFRQRYSHLLSEDFNPNEMYVRSTDVDRTLMSAQANLAGFFPPTSRSLWEKNLLWQPIPVHTIPSEMDNLLRMTKPCPAYKAEEARVIKSDEYIKLLSEYKSLFEYVSKHAGVKVEDFVDLEFVYSTLAIEKLYNFTIPDWAESIYEVMRTPACYSFVMDTYNSKMARLKIGPLIKEITKHMKKAARAHTSIKIATEGPDVEIIRGKDLLRVKEPSPEQAFNVIVFSAHDETVANLLHGLGLFDGNCPAYTATVLLELLDVGGEASVRVSVRNTPDIVKPVVMNITSCGTTCPLDKFISLYQDLMPNDWDKECQAKYFVCGLKGGWCWFNYTVLVVLIVCWAYFLFKTPYEDLCSWTFNQHKYSEISEHTHSCLSSVDNAKT